MNFVIHWNEMSLSLHVFSSHYLPLPIFSLLRCNDAQKGWVQWGSITIRQYHLLNYNWPRIKSLFSIKEPKVTSILVKGSLLKENVIPTKSLGGKGDLLGLMSKWLIPVFQMMCMLCVPSHFSCVLLFLTLWTIAHQAPLSIGFFKQEYWSGLSCPPPGDLPDLGSNSSLLHLHW